MTNDEMSALQEAAKNCRPFQTKTKIFEAGWVAYKQYLGLPGNNREILEHHARQRNVQLLLGCAEDLVKAIAGHDIYAARERLRNVLIYFRSEAGDSNDVPFIDN